MLTVPAAPLRKAVDVGFTSISQERFKSKFILVLFGFFQPSSSSTLPKSGKIVPLCHG